MRGMLQSTPPSPTASGSDLELFSLQVEGHRFRHGTLATRWLRSIPPSARPAFGLAEPSYPPEVSPSGVRQQVRPTRKIGESRIFVCQLVGETRLGRLQ